MRNMYDAVTPENIPADAQLVAGYLNGPYAWSAADWARFPNAVHVGISVRAAFLQGHVLDVEPGDATPAQSVGWVTARRAAGVDPSVYCNASTWPGVRAAFAAAGVTEPHYWIAKYDGVAALPAGAVAKQHTNTAGWDLSSVADHWPGVDPAPAPSAPSNEENIMLCKASPDNHVQIPCDGKTALFIAVGFGETVTILPGSVGVKDNQANGNPGYAPLQAGLKTINFDEPGPIAVAPGARFVSLRYEAKHDFTAWCA